MQGDVAILREVFDGRAYSARPGRLVSDADDGASLYFRAGVTCIWPVAEGRPLKVPQAQWQLFEGGWLPVEALQFIDPAAVYSVAVLWTPETYEPEGWKVDFHEPMRRTDLGFDTLDWALDVVVAPDRTYRVKDEDDYATYQERGLLTPDQTAQVDAAMAEVIDRIEAGTAPFTDDAFDWRPDPSWSQVSVPDGWDRITE